MQEGWGCKGSHGWEGEWSHGSQQLNYSELGQENQARNLSNCFLSVEKSQLLTLSLNRLSLGVFFISAGRQLKISPEKCLHSRRTVCNRGLSLK